MRLDKNIVVEMGMTEAGHIKKLVDIAPPNKALLTEIALVHAENFESLNAIACAKAEIFSHPKTELALISKDSPCCELLQKLSYCKSETYSMKYHEADFFMEVKNDALVFFYDGKAHTLPFVHFQAPHIYQNALAAMSMASACGMTAEEIGKALRELKLPQKRLELVHKGKICFVNDSYNAAEPSMKAALSYLKGLDAKRKVAVLGQMRELGKFSQGCHEAVGKHAVDCVDKVFCFGEECEPIVSVCKSNNMPVEWFIDFSELADKLKSELLDDDVVLLKGSRSNGLWRVIEHFN